MRFTTCEMKILRLNHLSSSAENIGMTAPESSPGHVTFLNPEYEKLYRP